MSKILIAWFVAGIVMMALGVGMVYGCVYVFPGIAEEYFSPVFRSAGVVDWTFYLHPFILSFGLTWFWERYKGILRGNFLLRAIEVSLVYGLVALLPILWLTFSAIDVSIETTVTWFLYGLVQSFAAGIVLAKINP